MIVACGRYGVKLELHSKSGKHCKSRDCAFYSMTCRLLWERHEFRQIKPSNMVGDVIWSGVRSIGQHHDSKFVVHIPGNLGRKALPFAFMLNNAVTANALNEPAESIVAGIGFSVVEFGDRPHL